MKMIVTAMACGLLAGCVAKPSSDQARYSRAAKGSHADNIASRYTEQELWQGIPLERLPLDSLELIVGYEPPSFHGVPGQEFMKPHRVGIGLRNTADIVDDDLDASLIFMHKEAVTCLKLPDGTTLAFRMDRGYRVNLTYTAMQPSEVTWFLHQPLWRWFPEVETSEDGLYQFWWEVGTHSSERLTLRKDGQDIWPERATEQEAGEYRR